MVSGGSSRITLPHVPQVSTTTPSAWQAAADRRGRERIGVPGPRLHELDGLHGAPTPDVADDRQVLAGSRPSQGGPIVADAPGARRAQVLARP